MLFRAEEERNTATECQVIIHEQPSARRRLTPDTLRQATMQATIWKFRSAPF